MIRIFLGALAGTFLAEFGDKTQLAVLSMTAASRRPWPVFAGAAVGLVLATGLGVLAGTIIERYVSPDVVRRAGAAAFVVLGIALWFKA